MPDDVRRLEDRLELVFGEAGIIDVRGRRGQAGLLQGIADLGRRAFEIAGELDFLVADGRDLRERSVDVLLHLGAHGIELHAETLDLLRVEPDTRHRRGANGADERAAIDHECSPRIRRPPSPPAPSAQLCIATNQERALSCSATVAPSPSRSDTLDAA